MSDTYKKIRNTAIVGIFSALSIVLVMFIHFPIFPAVGFLEYDPADIPILIITAFMGPYAGLIMTVVVSVVQGLTVSAASGWIGIIMHIFATGSYVAVFGAVSGTWRKKRQSDASKTKILLSLLCGAIAMIAAMALWNLLLTPYFMHVTVEVLLPLYPLIIAFNAIKAILNGAVAFLLYISLYKPVHKYFK